MYASMAPIATIGTAVLGTRITQAVTQSDGGQLAHTGSGSLVTTVVALAAVFIGFALLGLATKRRAR